MELTICVDALLAGIGSKDNAAPTSAWDNDTDMLAKADTTEPCLHRLSMPVSKLRRSRETRLIITEPQNDTASMADPSLIRLIATARTAHAAMLAAHDQSLGEVAKAQGYPEKYFKLLLRLATLDPSIVEAILDGRQPASLTRMRLAKITNLPVDWPGQRSALGFQ